MVRRRFLSLLGHRGSVERLEVLHDELNQAGDDDKQLLSIIRSIGETVVPSHPAVLAYFCHVDLWKQLMDLIDESSLSVQNEILHTLAYVIARVHDDQTLCYLLSRNLLNRLLEDYPPSDSRAWIELLKTLTLQLVAAPQWTPLFYHEGRLSLWEALVATVPLTPACIPLVLELRSQPHLSFSESSLSSLADYVCRTLQHHYDRWVSLTQGPVVDTIRATSLQAQWTVEVPHVLPLPRLCECVLQWIQTKVLPDLLPTERAWLTDVGTSDVDVLPLLEARAQVATCFLTQLRGPPALTRMIAVALWHPQSTVVEKSLAYPCTQTLHRLVEGSCETKRPNPYRVELQRALRGDYGPWRAAAAALLWESALLTLEDELMDQLDWKLDEALVAFLQRSHEPESAAVDMALDCVSSLAMEYALLHPTDTHVRAALVACRDFFYTKTLESRLGDMFVDVVESVVEEMYTKIVPTMVREQGSHARPYYGYRLAHRSCSMHRLSAQVILRKLPSVEYNEMESCRFYSAMALHFRAVCRFLDDPLSRDGKADRIDRAEKLTQTFGCIRENPGPGTDIDLRGRMTFPVSSGVDLASDSMDSADEFMDFSRLRSISEEILFGSSSQYQLVLDPTILFLVKARERTSRGTIICSIPLLNVIAAASDDEWIHIAVRHENVPSLILNHNMALRCEKAGTALIIRQYVDRCRVALRKESIDKIRQLFEIPPNDLGVPASRTI